MSGAISVPISAQRTGLQEAGSLQAEHRLQVAFHRLEQTVARAGREQPAILAGDAHLLQPSLKLRRALQAQRLAQIQRIVKGGALIVEHHVVGTGHAHDEVDAGDAEQGQQRIHIVLIGFGVVGVADVAAHGQAEQLAAEVIFKAGADDLLAVVEILRADEADDGVDQQRTKAARHRIGAGLAGSADRRR